MNKFKTRIEKVALKKYVKDASNKLADSDFKHNRVANPNEISEKRQKQVKEFMKGQLDKAYAYEKKKKERDAYKAAQKAKGNGVESHTPPGDPPSIKGEGDEAVKAEAESDDDMGMSEDESENKGTSPTEFLRNGEETPNLKRKRGDAGTPDDISPKEEDEDDSPSSPKKMKAPPPPPPPPPPPRPEGMELDDAAVHEADVNDASMMEYSGMTDELTPKEIGNSFREEGSPKAEDAYAYAPVKIENGSIESHPSPMQLATPSTNGSYPYDTDKKMESVKGEAVSQVDVGSGS